MTTPPKRGSRDGEIYYSRVSCSNSRNFNGCWRRARRGQSMSCSSNRPNTLTALKRLKRTYSCAWIRRIEDPGLSMLSS